MKKIHIITSLTALLVISTPALATYEVSGSGVSGWENSIETAGRRARTKAQNDTRNNCSSGRIVSTSWSYQPGYCSNKVDSSGRMKHSCEAFATAQCRE